MQESAGAFRAGGLGLSLGRGRALGAIGYAIRSVIAWHTLIPSLVVCLSEFSFRGTLTSICHTFCGATSYLEIVRSNTLRILGSLPCVRAAFYCARGTLINAFVVIIASRIVACDAQQH